MNNAEKYLPIGTVVMLKNGTKKVMITGSCSIDVEKNKFYDYCGCIYPEGYFDTKHNCLFNHSQIEKIYYFGYIDEEQKKQNSLLRESIKIN